MNNEADKSKMSSLQRIGAPIEPEMRPIWRVGLITLILYMVCRASKASSTKILALCSVISSNKKMPIFEDIMSGRVPLESLSIRFDPSVNRAIDLGLGEGIFSLDENKKIFLSQKGKDFAKAICKDDLVFEKEKEFLRKFSKNDLSETLIEKIVQG